MDTFAKFLVYNVKKITNVKLKLIPTYFLKQLIWDSSLTKGPLYIQRISIRKKEGNQVKETKNDCKRRDKRKIFLNFKQTIKTDLCGSRKIRKQVQSDEKYIHIALYLNLPAKNNQNTYVINQM